jgi:TrpR family trp operon transcriptional repressor
MARVKQKRDGKSFRAVARVLAEINSTEEMAAFLDELLTPAEVYDISLRWKLLGLLAQGMSQRRIAEDLRISLCKITRGSRILKQKGAVSARLLSDGKTDGTAYGKTGGLKRNIRKGVGGCK